MTPAVNKGGGHTLLALAERCDALVKHMAQRFLMWPLPENFSPDAGISFKPTFNDHMDPPLRHSPIGTNLFNADQAEAMVRFMLDGFEPSVCEWSNEERAAIREIGAAQGLSDTQVLRQALRLYQRDHFRRKAGETVTWSGDAQRAADFAGPMGAPDELSHYVPDSYPASSDELLDYGGLDPREPE